MWIVIMIISEALDVVGWGWMIKEETTLVKIVANYGDVTLGRADKHL
jgi:hypothetical protein